MDKKNFYKRKFGKEANIQGFDIEINPDAVHRIDRLVDRYEKEILMHLDDQYIRKTSWSKRLADKMAAFGGSWKFIIYFGIFLVAWMVWNIIQWTAPWHFDSPPFILLNLCLSFLAAFQAPIIMMSQNRQAARDKHESVIDFAINYKSEQEIDDMQSQLHQIQDELIEIKNVLKKMT